MSGKFVRNKYIEKIRKNSNFQESTSREKSIKSLEQLKQRGKENFKP